MSNDPTYEERQKRTQRYYAAVNVDRLLNSANAAMKVADEEQAELRAIVDRLKVKRAAYQRWLDVAIDEENLRWLPAIIGSLDSIIEGKP